MRVGLGKVRLYSSHKDRDQKAEGGSLRCDHSLIAQRGRYNHVEAVVDDGFCRFACLVMGRLPSRVAQLAEEMDCSLCEANMLRESSPDSSPCVD